MTTPALSRVPDSPERGDTPAHHAIDDLARQWLIRDHHHGLRIELADHPGCKLHHVWLAVLARVYEESIR